VRSLISNSELDNAGLVTSTPTICPDLFRTSGGWQDSSNVSIAGRPFLLSAPRQVRAKKSYARPAFSVKISFRMSSNIEQLEQQLDSFDAAQRKDAVAKLWDLAKAGTAGRTSSSVPFPVHKCFSGSSTRKRTTSYSTGNHLIISAIRFISSCRQPLLR